MPLFRLVLAGALCALPCAASAQPWRDAYKAGDYQKAAELLHPLVVQMAWQPGSADPDPSRHLATMYAQGLGVPKDPIAACELAQVAFEANQNYAPRLAPDIAAYDASIKAADAFMTKHCDELSEWDRIAAATRCFAFGMPEEVLTLGSHTVRVGRGGILLADSPPDKPDQILNCPIIVARVRALTIEPPADAAPGVVARHFVELFYWRGGQRQGAAASYALQWHLYEVHGKKIDVTLVEDLAKVDGWPAPALPKAIEDGLTLEMIPSGHVHWKLNGAPAKHGWIMLPEEKMQ